MVYYNTFYYFEIHRLSNELRRMWVEFTVDSKPRPKTFIITKVSKSLTAQLEYGIVIPCSG